MTKRIAIVVILMTALVGLTLMAESPLAGSWSSELLFAPGTSLFFNSLNSVFTLNYTLGSFLSTSESEFMLLAFIWQGFGLIGTLGALNIQSDLLFGPSTADYIYAQLIVATSIAGLDFGFYFAQLSDAVLQGPADGFAIRLIGSVGDFDIISITEFGARIEDNDFDGITIYHAATGLHKRYATNPIVMRKGFTGERLTVSGWQFGCVENISTTLYVTGQTQGFDWFKVEVERIDVGVSWLSLELELTFQLQTKGIVLNPTLLLGETACLNTYLDIRTCAPDDTIYGSYTSITGISLYGIGLTYSWNRVTIKGLIVLDTGRYAITTPEYGSVIEKIAEAVDKGHEFYPDYWELFSIKIRGDGCSKGEYMFLANTYFRKDASTIFDWGMTHVEASVPINSSLFLGGEIKADTDGSGHIGFGIKVSW